MQAVSRASRQLLRANPAAGVRRMSGGASIEEEVKEMRKWKSITLYLGIPASFAMAVYDLSHAHAHHPSTKKYPYLKVRSKEFPWGDCDLFDSACKEAAAKA